MGIDARPLLEWQRIEIKGIAICLEGMIKVGKKWKLAIDGRQSLARKDNGKSLGAYEISIEIIGRKVRAGLNLAEKLGEIGGRECVGLLIKVGYEQ